MKRVLSAAFSFTASIVLAGIAPEVRAQALEREPAADEPLLRGEVERGSRVLVRPGREPIFPLRMINGMETIRADAFRIAVYRGSATDNTGQALIQNPRSLTIDIRSTGPLGRDNVATPEDVEKFSGVMERDAGMPNAYRALYRAGQVHAGLPLAGWYHVLYLSGPGLDTSAMLTRQVSSMRLDRPGDARPPAKYIHRRLSPAVHYFDPVIGFRPMICVAWPQPSCNWSRLNENAYFQILSNGRSTSINEIDASAWVPPTGRILKLQAVVTSVGGQGGAYLKSLARMPGEIQVGSVQRNSAPHISFLEIATTSRRIISYRVDPGIKLDLYAMGFTMLQPF